MVKIVLVRPGATDYDEQGRIKGTLDIPLSEQGQQQAARIAQELATLSIDQIYSAPCRAALDTAAAIGQQVRAQVQPVDRLRNLNHGLWAGLTIAEVKLRQPRVYRQWQGHPETVCPPQGETVAEAQERVREVIDEIVRGHDHETIALVVPEPLASVVGLELGEKEELGDLWEVECACGGWQLIQLNGTPVRS